MTDRFAVRADLDHVGHRRVHARHQDEFITLDDVTHIPMTSPTTIRGWRHISTGSYPFDLKPARQQPRIRIAA